MVSLGAHGVKTWTDQVQNVDLESLYGIQVRMQIEFGEIDDLVPSVNGSMANDDERIYVALWQKSKCNFCSGVWTSGFLQTLPGRRFICGDL